MNPSLGRYALFSIICFVYAMAILWLLFRRRVTLQSSLLYLLLMVGLGCGFIVLHYVPSLVSLLGFTLPSNLFFSAAIGLLALLHLMGLMSISRLEQRSITLVQELALLQEQITRLDGPAATRTSAGVPVSPSTESSEVAPP